MSIDKANSYKINTLNFSSNNKMLSKAISVFYKCNKLRYLKNFIIEYLLNQISAKAGIREYNEKAVSILIAEFFQLDKWETFMALDSTKLTRRQKRKALKALLVIKQKWDMSIKGRTYANGRKQRE